MGHHDRSHCPSCEKDTTTINGLCPNCGALKPGAPVTVDPIGPRVRGDGGSLGRFSLGWEWENLLVGLLGLAAVVLIVVAVVVALFWALVALATLAVIALAAWYLLDGAGLS